MKRAIITGATGSVGMAIIKSLLQHHVEILVFCRKGSSRNNNIPCDPRISIRYCSLDELASVQNDTGYTYDVFYHLAWEGTTGEARNDMYLQNRNVMYTLDAVSAAERFGCKTFIGAGSQAEYGRVDSALSSGTPAVPETGYGIGKLCAGQMSRLLCEQKNMRHIWARILSVYGPYDNENSMIMSTIGKVIKGEAPSLTRGEQQWDYLYADDAGRAFYLLAERGIHGRTYCIGSGVARPLKEYMYTLRDQIDPSVPLGIGKVPYGAKQIMYLKADISELSEDTHFLPEVTFEVGIRNTINWYKEHYYEENQHTNPLL